MKMGRNGLLTYTLVVFALLPLLNECISVAVSDSLPVGNTLTGNQTMISKNEKFETGFFSPSGTKKLYMGTWSLPWKTVVWVANRESPLRKKTGVLSLSANGSFLGLFDERGYSVWQANVSRPASKAVISDSGNLLLLAADNDSETLWQSFDHPGNIWLLGMKFRGDQKLVSWKNYLDPAPGIFSLQMDRDNQFVLLKNNTVEYWRSQWNVTWISETSPFFNFKFKLSYSKSGSFYLTYTSDLDDFIGFSLQTYGVFAQVYYNKPPKVVVNPYPCEVHGLCGPYGICQGGDDSCICTKGWKPTDTRAWDLREWWSSGCVFYANSNFSSDGFITVPNIWVPDKPAYSYPAPTWEACEEACLRNSSCVAFSPEHCQIWSRDLWDLSHSLVLMPDLKLRVRVADGYPRLDLVNASPPSQYKVKAIVVAPVGALVIVLALITILYLWWMCRLRPTQSSPLDSSNSLLRMFSYGELKTATRNFRDKLGSGGFGSVFKGTLTDGTLVAVKRLEGENQAEKQFRAEINSVGIIHHVNLVRLRGFCAQGTNRLLVYDYMPNGSLNSYLFSNTPPKILDWRTRFEIALGTVRGLVYLHEECRERIIHSDVKPENILLNEDFSPKLGDFGMAKLVGRDFSQVLTTARGTLGYLAPEWITGLPITSKVDVYSFGMTLFEIISGRKNLMRPSHEQESTDFFFPNWVTLQICEGNMMNVVDNRIVNDADVEEVRRAVLVSLLCTQDDEEARPDMAQVLLILEGRTEAPFPPIPPLSIHQREGSDSVSGSLV